jgi:hypothetical protein
VSPPLLASRARASYSSKIFKPKIFRGLSLSLAPQGASWQPAKQGIEGDRFVFFQE